MNVLLKTNNHLGDVVILTAVIENLSRRLPDAKFSLDANESYLGIFEGNPHYFNFAKEETTHRVECVYAPYSQSIGNGGNCVRAFTDNAFRCFGLKLDRLDQRTAKFYFDMGQNQIGGDYCVINANYQTCSEVKGYPFWQEVVDSCPNLKFVQIGGTECRDVQKGLRGVIDVRGKTSSKDLVKLVSHAKCVVSPPSAVVHIASAFPNVRTVVVSGAREPKVLTEYPNTVHLTSQCHNFNESHGCMKFYVNRDYKNCMKVVEINGNRWPKCMADIDSRKVVEALCF